MVDATLFRIIGICAVFLAPFVYSECQYVSLNWESEVEALDLNASAADAVLVRVYLNDDDQEAHLIPVPLIVADQLSQNASFMPSVPYPINVCMASQNEYFAGESFRFICDRDIVDGTRKPFLQIWNTTLCTGTASHSKYDIDALLTHYNCNAQVPVCGFVTVEEQYFAVQDANGSLTADQSLDPNCTDAVGEAIESVYRSFYAVDVCVPSGQGAFKYVCDADTQQFVVEYYDDSECQDITQLQAQEVVCVNTHIPFYEELTAVNSTDAAIVFARSQFQACELIGDRDPTSICVQCKATNDENAGFCGRDTYRYGEYTLQVNTTMNGFPVYKNLYGAYIWKDAASMQWVLNRMIGSTSVEDSVFCEVNTSAAMHDDRTNFDVERCTWRWVDVLAANSTIRQVDNVLSRLECSVEDDTRNETAQDVTSIVVLSLLGIAVCVCGLGFYREYLARLERKRKLIQDIREKQAGKLESKSSEKEQNGQENTMDVQINLNQQSLGVEEDDANAVPDAGDAEENEPEPTPGSSSQQL